MELVLQATTDEDQEQEQCDDHLHQTVVGMVAATAVIVAATATTAVATVLGIVAAKDDAGDDAADEQAQLIGHGEYDTNNDARTRRTWNLRRTSPRPRCQSQRGSPKLT